MENFCEQRGFTFHVTGSGRWGAFPFYSFERTGNDEKESFLIAYYPHTEEVKIKSAIGTFTGKVGSVERFERVAEAMGIDVAAINDKEMARKNAEFKMERKMGIANRVASQVQIKYGFRYEKCVSLAQMGDWWNELNNLSQLSNRGVDACVAQVVQMIDEGQIH